MSEDPHALKLYIDGNAYNNPGGTGAIACFAEYPESWNRADEEIFSIGYGGTTNNRMELQACIRALEWVTENGQGLTRVQIVSDSRYVCDNVPRAVIWRKNGWKTLAGRPIDNPDLWKRLIAARSGCRVRVDIVWRKGKRSPILKSVDRAAKAAGKSPTKVDRGYRTGKIGRSKLTGSASTPYPASGQEQTLRVYRSGLIGKRGHKVYFDVFDDDKQVFKEKCNAYTSQALIAELHRGHTYRVRFNDDPRNPTVLAIVSEVANA